MEKRQYIWAFLRIGMGWIFLWAFVDKLLGLGFATEAGNAWIRGGSPTSGFLTYAAKGFVSGFYQSLAGNVLVDWIFMGGLLFIGFALILGVLVKIAAYSGTLMLLLIYTAGFLPPENNPFLDEHIIYSLILVNLTFVKSGYWFGLGRWWSKTTLVKRYPFLE